jgi:hypothetical protein
MPTVLYQGTTSVVPLRHLFLSSPETSVRGGSAFFGAPLVRMWLHILSLLLGEDVLALGLQLEVDSERIAHGRVAAARGPGLAPK